MDNLEKDLISLYCSTKDKKIEDILIRYANTSYGFLEWLKTADIRSMVRNQATLDGMSLLMVIRDKFPSGATFPDVAKFLTSNQSNVAGFIAVKAFSDLQSDPRCSDILSNFSDILNAVSPMTLLDKDKKPVSDTVNTSAIAEDLERIKNEFTIYKNEFLNDFVDIGEKIVKKKETKKEATQRVFTYLLHEFTSEIGTALKNLGDRRANIIEEWAIVNPIKIASAFPSKKNTNLMANDVLVVVRTIIKILKERSPEEHYNYIRNRALLHGNSINEEQYRKYYADKMNNIDLSQFTGQPSNQEEQSRIDMSDVKLTNPDTLVFISLVLYGLYEKVK